jgi:hypothetical protein
LNCDSSDRPHSSQSPICPRWREGLLSNRYVCLVTNRKTWVRANTA